MITTARGNLLDQDVQAIVNPANSWHIMGGGVAGQIKRHAGEWIEKQAMQKGPTPVGEAIVTSAGRLKAEYVIHAPTMKRPAERTSPDAVYLAARAAMLKARELGLKSIAFPCMGAGVGGVPPRLAARAIVSAIKEVGHEGMRVVLVALDERTEQEFMKAIQDEGLD